MTLAWIDEQIDSTIRGPKSPESVYYLAALLMVRDHLQAVTPTPSQQDAELWEKVLKA